MKILMTVFSLFVIVTVSTAQVKIDTGYTVVIRGLEDKKASLSLVLGNLDGLMIKENATGKICTPLSMKWTLIVQSEIHITTKISEVQSYISRLKPQDMISIEKIMMPSDCFPAPKQIVITII